MDTDTTNMVRHEMKMKWNGALIFFCLLIPLVPLVLWVQFENGGFGILEWTMLVLFPFAPIGAFAVATKRTIVTDDGIEAYRYIGFGKCKLWENRKVLRWREIDSVYVSKAGYSFASPKHTVFFVSKRKGRKVKGTRK
jgi:hypothetical protein